MELQLLLTGNELMSGDITETNSVMIADYLKQLGLTISRKAVVGDNLNLLTEQLQLQSQQSDVLIVNGGLGPTVDDMTVTAICNSFELDCVLNEASHQHLQNWCERLGFKLDEANLKQAYLPKGCAIIANPIGSAVGFSVIVNDCLILCTPGVPRELKAMFEGDIPKAIRDFFSMQNKSLERVITKRIHTFGLGESNLQQRISEAGFSWLDTIELGFRSGAPTLEVKVSADQQYEALIDQAYRDLQAIIGDYISSTGGQSQPARLIELLKQQGKTLTTAESCTGGLISATLTSEPGSSEVFDAGFVTYGNHIKSSVLGVDSTKIETHGAVSEAVVLAMAAGALKNSGADYVVAVSGVAGPNGGSEINPVGSVWIAWGEKGKNHHKADLQAIKLFYPMGRKHFQTMVTGAALDLIRRKLLGITAEPRYLKLAKARAENAVRNQSSA